MNFLVRCPRAMPVQELQATKQQAAAHNATESLGQRNSCLKRVGGGGRAVPIGTKEYAAKRAVGGL